MEAIRNYVEALFAALPQREDILRLKADMLANLEDKFNALLAEGKSEAEATGVVIASIGSTEDLLRELGLPEKEAAPTENSAHRPVDPALAEEYRRYQSRKHCMVAVAVALFILSPFSYSLFENILYLGELNNFLFFAMIAAGVALIILSGRQDDYYEQLFALGSDEESDADDVNYPVTALFSAIAFPTATVIYLLIGILWNLWHPGWIIYVVCGALTSAIAGIEYYRHRKI